MRKAAATAKTYGVSLDELNGYTAAIGSSTRETGSVIGTSLKTIFSRTTTFDPAIDALNAVGVSINDINGKVRPVSEILGELAGKWDTLTDSQRQNLGVNVAGMNQQTRFLALMNNWKMATDATTTSINSQGSAMKEQEKYSTSLEARLNRLDTAWNKVVLAFGEAVVTDGLISGIETLNSLATAVASITKYTGVLPVVFSTVGVAVVALSAKFRAFSSALIFGTEQLTAQQIALTGLTSRMTVAGVASRALSASLRGLAVASGVGIILAGVGIVLEKLISEYSKAKQAQEDFKLSQEKGIEALTTNKEQTDELLKKYKELTEVKKNAGQNWSNQQEQEYLQIQNKLAEIYPQLVKSIDGAGNSHLKNTDQINKEIEATNKLIEAKKKETIANAKGDISKSMSDMNDIQGQIDDAKNPYIGESYDPWGILPKLTLSGKEATEENKYNIQLLQNQWSDAAQKINATVLTIADAYSKLEIDPNIRKSVDDFVSSLDFSKVKDPAKLEAYSKRVAELTDKMQQALEDGNKKAFNDARDSLEDYTDKIVDTNKTGSDLSVSFDDVKKSAEEMTNATYAGKDGLDGVGDAMEGATTQADQLSQALKDAQGDFEALAAVALKYAQSGDLGTATTIAQVDAYKAASDEISVYNELLEKMAQGKEISAAEAMNLISQEEDLAGAISIENGIVKVNEQAVVSLRDAKVASYQDMINALKAQVEAQAQATAANLKNYGVEIQGILSVADAQNVLAQIEKKRNEERAKILDYGKQGRVGSGYVSDQYDQEYDQLESQINSIKSAYQRLDQLSALSATSLEQVGTSAEKLSDSTDKANKSAEESIYITDAYKQAQEKLNLALEEQRKIKSQFADRSKEYRAALQQEINLLKEQKALIDGQTSSLSGQIASGNIRPTGLIKSDSLSSGGYSGGSSYVTSSSNYAGGDVRNISNVSASSLNQYLKGALSGMGDAIISAGKANGIDPAFLAAIAMHESGNGSSNAVRNKNNAFGIMSSSGGIRVFSSLAENINYEADMLRRLYINQGLTTIPAIQKKYAPVGASNDPYGQNKDWQNGVTAFWNKFKSGASSAVASVATTAVSSVKDYYLNNFRITSEYGEKRGNTTHKGVDFANGKQGDPVKAIASGKVITATYSSSAGNWVVVQQNDGTVAKYMHMMNGSLAVKAGDSIVAGQQLGKIGSTGESSGAHLHLQVERNGQAIDPLAYLKSSGGTYNSGASVGQDYTQAAAEAAQAIDEAKSQVNSLQQESLQVQQQIQQLYMDIVNSNLTWFDYAIQSFDDELSKIEYDQNTMNKYDPAFMNNEVSREDIYQTQINYSKEAVEYLKQELAMNKQLTEAQRNMVEDKLAERYKELWSLEQKLYDRRIELGNEVIDTYKKAVEAQKDIAVKTIDKMIEEINKESDEADYKKKLGNAQKDRQETVDEMTKLMLDDSPAAKKKLADLQKQLSEQDDSILEIQTDKAKEDRINNLNDQKDKTTEYYDNILNNEAKFDQMRENIVKMSTTQIQNDLTAFSANIQANAELFGTSLAQNLVALINRANGYIGNIFIKPIEPAAFDTGGMTSGWGSDGKLAMLHEKEIVLNKDDTSNFLKAINFTRNLIGNLKMPSFKSATPAVSTAATGGGSPINVNFYVDKMTGSQSDLELFATKFQNAIKLKGG